MPTNTDILGIQYTFGFQSSDAPTIAHFFARKAELTYEPETFAQAMDGEGLTEAVALTKKGNRKISGTFTGYIEAGYSGNAISNTFTFVVDGVTRFFIVKSISDPRNKGEFAEVALTVESYSLVNS